MYRIMYTLFLFILLTTLLRLGSVPSENINTLLLVSSYGILSAVYLYSKKMRVSIPLFVVIFIILTKGIQVLHVGLNNIPPGALGLYPVYSSFIILSVIIIIPYAIEPEHFLHILSRLSFFLVIIGFATILFGEYEIFSITISTREAVTRFPFTMISDTIYIPRLESVFSNPNPLAAVLIGGLMASIYELDSNRNFLSLVLTSTNIAGLYLTNSHSGIIISLIGVSIYFVVDREWYMKTNLRVLVASFVVISTTMVLFYTEQVVDIAVRGLSGRNYIWSGVIYAWLNKPIFGEGIIDASNIIAAYIDHEQYSGASPHNSYLNVLITTGIVGMSAYVGFIIYSVSLWIKSQNTQAIFFSLVVAYSLHQMFEVTSSLLGIDIISIISLLSIGYLIRDTIVD